MTDEVNTLVIPTAERESFVLCLALGTLEAILADNWSAEAGTWTLARPAFIAPLQQSGIPTDVLDVLSSADELSAIEKFVGKEAVKGRVTEMIAVIRNRLAALPERSWSARWLGD